MTLYEVLQVSPNASNEVIEMAYKALAKKYHPDLNPPEKRQTCNDLMQKINHAHEVLANEKLRKQYDISINLKKDERNDDTGNIHNKTQKASETNTPSSRTNNVEFYKNMYTRMIEENKKDLEYHVKVYNTGSIVLPRFCTCCMGSADEKRNISYTWQSYNVERRVSLDFSICSACISHDKEVKRKNAISVWVSVIFGVVGVWLIQYYYQNYTLSSLLGILAGFICLLLTGILIKAQTLSPEHSEREEFTRIIECNEKYTLFSFSNWMYAELFALKNDSAVNPANKKRHVNSSIILTARKKRVSSFFICALFILIFGFTGYSIAFENIGSNREAINSSYNAHSTESIQEENDESKSVTLGTESDKQTIVIPEVKPPPHGDIRVFTNEECIAPFEVKSSEGNYYLVKLVDVANGSDIITCFIYGGKSIEFEVPLGRYFLKYAVISKWHGYDNAVKQDAVCFKSDDIFDFEVDGEYVNGYTVTLYKVSNGNMETESIPPDEF